MSDAFELFLRVIPKDQQEEAMQMALEIMDIAPSRARTTTPALERLALIFVRSINPAYVFSEKQECLLRGLSAKTLKSMKDNKELPCSIAA